MHTLRVQKYGSDGPKIRFQKWRTDLLETFAIVSSQKMIVADVTKTNSCVNKASFFET